MDDPHQTSLTEAEERAFNAGWRAIVKELEDENGDVRWWSAIRATGALHFQLVGGAAAKNIACRKCNEALEKLEDAHFERGVQIERGTDAPGGRTLQ